MPIGKIKWYDPERGFGFVSNPGSEDVFVSQAVLPDGVTELHRGQRIEFDFASGKKGPQALRVAIIDPPRVHAKPQRVERKHSAEELGSVVADLVNLLDGKVLPQLTAGHYPDRKEGKRIAEILRAVAAELDI
ncbi:cold shock domain-containing protein [Corynebacterium sp. ES2794-CONJ1]|uniref:cold-shock protein n=1 Tax=unclassified Corynebacterium TaxID=2624378 RepID=UPI00216A587E|nr:MULTISPECIES: cold shock domain-containing protein [unclassified Corynebacterium]MCS4490062.1 cold shock domain-containing protein [Corynebacterium sp. ES2775-CONJ]MCS4491576.1 cold shock domain-containing protein [Corynebacterium sp. ES2715-CONJ3]MCS4531680.1 cold shock domain-containing protein [Corynebacterium sp. ES2730-CONJ]MCU9519076.1 cold shock domain-containing protein [Corynebacterium sp. ES2794-CONJ1]